MCHRILRNYYVINMTINGRIGSPFLGENQAFLARLFVD